LWIFFLTTGNIECLVCFFGIFATNNVGKKLSGTHTRLTALFLGLPGLASTRKVKPIWISLKQDSEWQWHQLGHMQVCTSFQTDNHASTPPLSFLHAGCPSCRPTNSIKALKQNKKNYLEVRIKMKILGKQILQTVENLTHIG